MAVTRPTPPPLEDDGIRFTIIGTACWTVALVVLLALYPWVRDEGHLWWYGTCAAGIGLGLLGGWYCRRRVAAIARS